MTRVETQHWHLVEPLHDFLILLLRDTLKFCEGELVHHVSYDCCVTTLQGLVEKADQLYRITRYDVLRLGVQGVRQGDWDGYVLTLVKEVTGWANSLASVLVWLEVVNDCVGVRLRLHLQTVRVFPGGGFFMLPLFNHPVTLFAKKLSPKQGELVSGFPAHRLLLGVQPWDHFTLPGLLQHQPLAIFRVALFTTMPKTTVKLENRFPLRVITIHSGAKNLPLTSMPAPSVVDVDVTLLRLPLEPFDCNETASLLWIKSTLIGRSRRFYLIVGTVDFGLTTTAIICHMSCQMARLGESCLAFPASVGARNLLEICDQESVSVVKTHVQQRNTNLVIVGWNVGQDEVTVRLHRISSNTLLEMFFKKG